MTKELDFSHDLIKFLEDSPSPFHVVSTLKKTLIKKGFEELLLGEKWDIEKEGKYFVTKNDSALIAFIVGKGSVEEDGFKIVGAHTDSPTFRVKSSPEMVVEGSYLRLNTEIYGGPIVNTWLDRPLSLAGRVALKSNNPLNPETKLVNINKPLLIIPNLAIHMNGKVNEGIKLNPQKETLPLVSVVDKKFEKDNFLMKLLAENIGVDCGDIMEADLFLYEYEKGSIVGLNDEFISCGRLDDLAMIHAEMSALINAEVGRSTNVMVCFDNEEVGSATKQGAASPMLKTVLERICLAMNKNREDFYRSLSNSFMISSDMAHALHPNYTEKQDPTNRPVLNGGPAIKINASQSYTSDSITASIYKAICKGAGVPCQSFYNRSDERGGSTIGPISSTQLDIPSVDIGNPILSMHSIRELGGVMDHYYVAKSFEEFYRI